MGYVEVRISRSVYEGPFDFEITRVDCISKCDVTESKDVHVINFNSLVLFEF